MTGDSDLRVKEVIVDSRINKVLAMRTDSVPMLEALDAISEFYVSNTIDTRRLLRQDLELQNVNLAKKFLAEFDVVKAKICDVEDLSNSLLTDCSALAAKMKNADENMKSFMEKASHLETRRNFFTQQSTEILSFLSRFQLSNEEIDLLYNADLNNSRSANLFFEALQRLKNAYADCKAMVEKHCYSVGFELLEVLGQHQDTAYQHLFDWVKNKCNALAETGASDDYDTNKKLQTAIRYLKKLPIYFSQCQDLLVNSRRTQLVQRFISALTQGEGVPASSGGSSSSSGTNKSLRAIDLHSHDPLKYVGGMLSWTHQAVASELEFLEAIFEDSMDRSDGGASAVGVKPSDSAAATAGDAGAAVGEGDLTVSVADGDVISSALAKEKAGGAAGLSIPELLAHCLQGLGRPLRVRIIQTLETRAVLSTLYGLTDLLSFYESTFARILAVENAVHSAVKGCLQECRRSFLSSLAKQQDHLTKSVVSSTVDLKASHVTRECTSQIHELYAVFNNAMSSALLDTSSSGGDASGSNPFHIETVLESIVQPLLTSCRLGGQSLQEAEMAIYMLNNISVIQSEITEGTKSRHHQQPNRGDASLSPWKELLSTESSTWIDILVKEEVSRTLRRSDLDKLLEIIELLPKGLKASEQIGLSQDRVSTIVRAFYASLFSTFAPQFERLQDPSLREAIRIKIAQRMYAAHKTIHDFVSEESNGYDSSILVHSVTEVGVLLGYDSAASADSL